MPELFLFTHRRFTAGIVAKAIGQKLGRELAYQEADPSANVDGNIDVNARVHVQVGADYLIVGALSDRATLRTWPARRNIAAALQDLLEALRDFSHPLS